MRKSRSSALFLALVPALLCSGLLLALAVVSAIPGPWVSAILVGLAGTALVGLLAGGHPKPGHGWVIPFAFLLVWLTLQAVNATHHQVVTLAVELQPRAHVAWLPGSVSRPDTLQALFLLAVAGLLLALGRDVLSRNRVATRMAVVALVSGATCIALLAILQRLTPKPAPVFELTGSFVSENQYAAFMNLMLPLTLWLALDYRRRAAAEGRLSHPGTLFFALAGLQLTSILLSGSRAGIVIALALLACSALLEWRRWRHHANRLGNLPIAPLLAALVLGLGAAVFLAGPTLRREFSSITKLRAEFDFRGRILGATWDLFRSRWMSGTGAGTFHLAFRYIQPEEVKGHVRHAHCEPLQTLAELGLPGAVAAAAALGALLRRPRSQRGLRRTPAGLRLGSASHLALVGLAVHACIDFPFREPSIWLTAVLFLGLSAGGGLAPDTRMDGNEEPS